MNILFVVDRLDTDSDANLNLIKHTASCFKNSSTYFLGHSLQKADVSDFCFNYTLDEAVRKLYFAVQNMPLHKKIFALLCKPNLAFFGLLKLFNIDIIANKYKKHIKKICQGYNIDAVVSVSAPFYTAKALAAYKGREKKIIVMFDPYGEHYIFGSKRTRQIERRCLEKADKVFVPSLIAKNYSSKKVTGFEFPSINEELYCDKLPDNKDALQLVYVGSLYSDIRNPDFLFTLLEKISQPKIHLTIVGGLYGTLSEEFYKKHDLFIKSHVTFTGAVPKEKAYEYLKNADVLVNIGNLIENQMPSKIFEYISTGKPVLNIAQIENCPTIPYFKLYKNAFNVFAFDANSFSRLDEICKFLNNRHSLDKEFIFSTFNQMTGTYFAAQLESAAML